MEKSMEEVNKLLQSFGIELPTYVKQLLCYTGFDNVLSVSLMTNNDICYMEKFAQTELVNILEEEEQKIFFNFYWKNKEKFKIMEGHKKILRLFIESCLEQCKRNKNELKRKVSEKGKEMSKKKSVVLKKKIEEKMVLWNSLCQIKTRIKTWTKITLKMYQKCILKTYYNPKKMQFPPI